MKVKKGQVVIVGLIILLVLLGLKSEWDKVESSRSLPDFSLPDLGSTAIGQMVTDAVGPEWAPWVIYGLAILVILWVIVVVKDKMTKRTQKERIEETLNGTAILFGLMLFGLAAAGIGYVISNGFLKPKPVRLNFEYKPVGDVQDFEMKAGQSVYITYSQAYPGVGPGVQIRACPRTKPRVTFYIAESYKGHGGTTIDVLRIKEAEQKGLVKGEFVLVKDDLCANVHLN